MAFGFDKYKMDPISASDCTTNYVITSYSTLARIIGPCLMTQMAFCAVRMWIPPRLVIAAVVRAHVDTTRLV